MEDKMNIIKEIWFSALTKMLNYSAKYKKLITLPEKPGYTSTLTTDDDMRYVLNLL
jgi:hypothetical protein